MYKNSPNLFLRCIYVALLLVVLQSCVAIQSFPTVARSGDTVTLAVGSPDGMTKGNTTAEFVSNDPAFPASVNLEIRSIFKLRPDNTSQIGTFNSAVSVISSFSSHGPWLSVIVIDLPPGLPLGAGVINVTTEGVYKLDPDVNTVPIGIEILEGTGAPATFAYDDGFIGIQPGALSALEPLQQVVIRPPFAENSAFPYGGIGAVEFKVNVAMRQISDGSPVTDLNVRVVADDMPFRNGKSHVTTDWFRDGDEITVIFLSSTGDMSYFQTRFSVVMSNHPNFEYVQSPVPAITSVKFYDVDGELLTGMPGISDYSITLE